MVSQNSAMLHSAHEIRVPCDEDHTHIAKLKRTEAGLYHIIRGHIQQALEKFQAPEPIMQRRSSRGRDIDFAEARAPGQPPGRQFPQQMKLNALRVDGPELEGQSRAPLAQDQQDREQDASAPMKKVLSRNNQTTSAEICNRSYRVPRPFSETARIPVTRVWSI
jgi:hypothetical protein